MPTLLLLLLLSAAVKDGPGSVAASPVAVSISASTPTAAPLHILGLQAGFGPSVPSSPSPPRPIALPRDSLGCDAADFDGAPKDAIALSRRGNCTFVAKAVAAESAGLAALLVANSDDSLFSMPGQEDVSIPVVMISRSSADALLSLLQSTQGEVAVSLRLLERALVDASVLVLAAIAVATVVVGALGATQKERSLASGRAAPVEDLDISPHEVSVIGLQGAIAFIVGASMGLILLFFFIGYLIYVLLLVFAAGGSSSMVLCLAAPLRKTFPATKKQANLPCIGQVEMVHLILTPLCYGIGIWWIIARKTNYAWVLQDILAIALLLVIQRTVRLPDIKVSTVLLLMAFIYDIFWVFISPFFFRDSVMVHVATGGSTGEPIPMLIRFPRINDELGGYSLLGLGDIALPGLFISYLLRFDYSKNLHGMRGYFPLAVLGYSIGLSLTDLALIVFQTGQPALLYIVPTTLGLVSLVAHRRKHLREMWTGAVVSLGTPISSSRQGFWDDDSLDVEELSTVNRII